MWSDNSCPYCGYTYTNLNDYASHLDAEHPIDELDA